MHGTYTLFPYSFDEEIVLNVLSDKNNSFYPDLTVVVAVQFTIKRSIILYQQARELGVPAIFVVNMIDEMADKGIDIDFPKLEAYLQTKVYKISARTGKGIEQLIKHLDEKPGLYFGGFQIPTEYQAAMDEARKLFH